jgi:endonuclease VIII
MPEGDTVHKVARTLHKALVGHALIKTDFRVPALATLDFAGETLEKVLARGKHILMRTGNGQTIHSHLAMEGDWHLYRRGERWRAPAHWARLVLVIEEWEAVGLRLKICEVIPTSGERGVVGHLGPDPLGPDWDAGEALRRLISDGSRPIGKALLDQRIIAGLGNVYRSEICFLNGIHPDRIVADLPDAVAVVWTAQRLMQANRERGNQVTTGDTRPGRQQWVYGRARRPCMRCGALIERQDDGSGRVKFWCPSCQPN